MTVNQPLVNTSSDTNLIGIDNGTYIQKPICLSSCPTNRSHHCTSRKTPRFNRQHYHEYDQPQPFPSTTNDLIENIDVEDIEFDDRFGLTLAFFPKQQALQLPIFLCFRLRLYDSIEFKLIGVELSSPERMMENMN